MVDVVERYISGDSISDISKSSGMSRVAVRNILKHSGVYENKKKITPFSGITKEHLKTLCDNHTTREIANRYNVSQSTVSERLRRFGLKSKAPEAHNKIHMPPKDELYNMYVSQMLPMSVIAKHYGVSINPVKTWLQKYEIPLRSHRRNQTIVMKKYNEQYFKEHGQHFQSDPHFIQKCIDGKLQNDSFPKYSGKEQGEICGWLNANGGNFEQNVRGIFYPNFHEIDIYDAERKIGIEYCGIYYHNELHGHNRKGRSSHWFKYKMAEERDIRLITIFSDEWAHHRTGIENYLKSICFPAKHRIHARQCAVRKISFAEASYICDDHIQGMVPSSSLNVGIEYNGVLVGAMVFGKHHRNNNQNHAAVLSRLCFLDDYQVVGGTGKMLGFARGILSSEHYTKIISWSDNRWSSGNVYGAVGFSLEAELEPDYSYVNITKPFSRIPKQAMQKKKIGCPPEYTENEWTKHLGYSRIWDCGKKRWTMNI